MSSLQQIAVGVFVGMVAIGLPAACTSSGSLTPLVRCQLDSLKVLPRDPLMVTPYDAIDLVNRLRECERADGGP